jgi:hypothetical protein
MALYNREGKVKILIACEESQEVCKAFREKGHEAYSCDIEPCSGGHPEWHIMGNALKVINGCCTFQTMDGKIHVQGCRWDMLIAHPPCTYLTNCATRSHSTRCTPVEKINTRTLERIDSMGFFMKFVYAECDRIAIENPIGVMNTCYRQPDQIIHPYMFAESENDIENYVTKSTCLWLKGLRLLDNNGLIKPDNHKIFGTRPNGRAFTWEEKLCRAGGAGKARSKTFPGIAKAMAEQWG